jgi:dihydroorotate dehydrogenase electron transfer subunit
MTSLSLSPSAPDPPGPGQRGSSSRGGGPVRELCEVLAHRRIGNYHALTFVSPEVAERSAPGQFVSLGVEGAGTVLRRPFSIYAVSQQRPWAGTVEVVFDTVGSGTKWLASREKHDVVDLVGPLGRSFPLPGHPVPCLLIGGGYDASPLLYLAQVLGQQGLRVEMIMGAATQDRIFNAIEAKRLSASTTFTTEDGSFGARGRVTDVLETALDNTDTKVIYACGPMPMLAAVSAIAARRRIPCQVAVEEAMACGVGVCWTCVVPYAKRDVVQNLRACVEGPVFNGARVVWDALGYPARPDPAHAPIPEPDELEEFRP